jgi:hypothetical protein
MERTHATLGTDFAQAFAAKDTDRIRERDGRIGWMRVVCSGFRPI